MSLRSALSFGLVLALFAFARPAASADPKPSATERRTTRGGGPRYLARPRSKSNSTPQKAPISVENFLAYVDAGHYDGTIFHRVIPGFMIQGGGFDASMKQKPTRGADQERGRQRPRRTRAARSRWRAPATSNSATSQFFINVVDNGFLNHGGRDFGYAVFGKVTTGMDVVDKIAAREDAARRTCRSSRS